jgi:hypothetical protein
VNIRPIFKMMEEAPGLTIPNDPSTITAAVIQETLEKAKAHVKTRVSYVFNKRKANPEVWKVATWSKHIAHSYIRKYGTEEDQAHLPAATKANEARQQTGRKRKTTETNRVGRRVRRQAAAPVTPVAGDNDRAGRQAPAAGVNNSVERQPRRRAAADPVARVARVARPVAPAAPAPGELPDVRNQLSEAAQERGRQIANEIEGEMQPEVDRFARNNRRGRGRVGADGTLVHFHDRQGQERNAGDQDYSGWLSDTVEDD